MPTQDLKPQAVCLSPSFRKLYLICFGVLLATMGATFGQLVGSPSEYNDVGIDEHLGEQIPLNLVFNDEAGNPISLKSFFGHGQPVVLILAYYKCPMLCTLVLNGTATALDALKLEPNQDFKLVTISIDPSETAELAKEKQKHYLNSMSRKLEPAEWHFLTGTEENISQLADALGFRYKYIAEKEQFVHAAVIHVLTDDGRISRYLYGIQFKPNDLKLAILEASEGKVGSVVDRVLLYCFHYDPAGKKYRLFAVNIMRIGGAVTVLLLAMLLTALWVRERHHKSSDDSSECLTTGNSGPSAKP